MTREPSSHLFMRSDANRIPLPDKSVSLVLGSPPYCDARTYGINAQRDAREWVEWMLGLTTEAVMVSRGLVLWVCAGVTRDHCYWPACEGLLWRWWEAGGECWRPAYWRRVGIPGSGGPKWLRADVEYVLAFKGPDNDFWSDNLACGKRAKYDVGGAMSNRHRDGQRANGNRKEILTARNGNARGYSLPEIANPGNFHSWEFSEIESEWLENPTIHTKAGGGHLGSPYAHENEAPFPEDLAEFFVRSFCPPGGIVLDPFSGSGTTVTVAEKFGRIGIGGDIRLNQCELGRRRLERPHAPVKAIHAEVDDADSFSLT